MKRKNPILEGHAEPGLLPTVVDGEIDGGRFLDCDLAGLMGAPWRRDDGRFVLFGASPEQELLRHRVATPFRARRDAIRALSSRVDPSSRLW